MGWYLGVRLKRSFETGEMVVVFLEMMGVKVGTKMSGSAFHPPFPFPFPLQSDPTKLVLRESAQ